MLAITEPAPYSFSRNPVVFEFTNDSAALVIFTISFAGNSFQISAIPSGPDNQISFDISELLANMVYTYDITLTHQVNIPGFVQTYTVTSTGYSFTGKVIPGGLSLDYRTFLIKEGYTPFEFRFFNPMANFLLTTRTDDEVIKLSRNEVCPVFFLCPSAGSVISVISNNGHILTLDAMDQGTPCMINLPLLIQQWSTVGIVTDIMFSVDGEIYLKMKISDRFNENSYILKFKSSLGVYEQLEVTGQGKRSLPSSNSDATFNTFDDQMKELRKNKQRDKRSRVITVETGYKSTDDLLFISDLLLSDDVTFINDIDEQKCLVTSDFSTDMKQITPESITLKIEFVNASDNYTPYKKYNPNFVLVDETGIPITDENNEPIYAI